jgi:hypothetical protein
LRCKGLECFALLSAELVLLIDAPHATNHAPKALLGWSDGTPAQLMSGVQRGLDVRQRDVSDLAKFG